GGQNSGFGFSGFDISKAGGGSNFSDIFNEIFKGRRKRPKAAEKRPQKGQDLQYVMNLSFMDALKGITTEITVSRQEQCATCRGSGHIHTGSTRKCSVCGGSGKKSVQSGVFNFEQDCYACGGTGVAEGESCRTCSGNGTVATREKINVRIPAGVDNGSRVRVQGKGNAGVRGGTAGDLYIITRVEPHDVFTRKGNNIYVTIPITVSEAALGSKIEVPTIDGTATIRIPPATQSGQRFRLRERGAPALRGGARGDQFVEVKIVLPKVVDEDAKELYRKLKSSENWNPREDLFSKL
ncbi:MAG: J domain-containing protein, partial [Holophagales bacterium]|nr:J domain-containing protein [Holophagales bacterium]